MRSSKINWIVVAIITALVVLIALRLCGCQTQPVTMVVPDKGLVSQDSGPAPLTVIPHPTMGFELVLVPPGTQIDGFTTLEPGIYMSGRALVWLLRKMEEVEDPNTYSKQ